jgi:hypothetical protein
MSDRIAGISLPAYLDAAVRAFLSVSAYPLLPVNLRFPRRSELFSETSPRRKVFEKSHRCSRCSILDIVGDQTHRKRA